MRATRQYLFYAVIACAACLALPPVASVQADPEADNREVASYRLTEPALAKYADATHRLAAALAESPPPCEDAEDNSLSAMAARLDAVPGASAALSDAGMASREYIVFGLATFQAGMGAWALTAGGGELPPGVAGENVAFYQAHEAEFQDLTGVLPEDDCEGDEEEGDREDDGSEHDG